MSADASIVSTPAGDLPLEYSLTEDAYGATAETLAAEEAAGEPLPAEGAFAPEAVVAAPARSPMRGFNTGQLIFWTPEEIDFPRKGCGSS